MLREPSSFRDPSGFVYTEGGTVYRAVSDGYAAVYDRLIGSGLYGALQERGWLVAHEETSGPDAEGRYRTLRPEPIPFISYPYEWSFHQLKDAALLTLDIQRLALERGMVLKDASAYNVQFFRGRPVLIDTLSFNPYADGEPWIAYRQFCRHFLAPLALMSRTDIRLGKLGSLDIDGISLDLAASLLPKRSRLTLGLGAHIHLQASGTRMAQARPEADKGAAVSKIRLLGILSNLEATIRGLEPVRQPTVWHGYYGNTNYSSEAAAHKEEVIAGWLERLAPATVWDAGANDARFSRLASSRGIWTLATDIDPYAVDDAYGLGDPSLLPLIVDLANPSPAIGWGNSERRSFLERVQTDLVMALALVHHLAIGYNLPLERIADLFADAGRQLAIEFVPKRDSKVRQLLSTREDIFADYDEAGFEEAFRRRFEIVERIAVKDSERTLYLMRRYPADKTAGSDMLKATI